MRNEGNIEIGTSRMIFNISDSYQNPGPGQCKQVSCITVLAV